MSVKGTVPAETGSVTYQRRAGEAIAAYTVVCFDGILILKADPLDATRMPSQGIIQAAATEGNMATAYAEGIITNPSWNFTSGQAIFLMSGGVIGHSAPELSGNIVQQLGEALTKNTIFFKPEDTIMVIGA